MLKMFGEGWPHHKILEGDLRKLISVAFRFLHYYKSHLVAEECFLLVVFVTTKPHPTHGNEINNPVYFHNLKKTQSLSKTVVNFIYTLLSKDIIS